MNIELDPVPLADVIEIGKLHKLKMIQMQMLKMFHLKLHFPGELFQIAKDRLETTMLPLSWLHRFQLANPFQISTTFLKIDFSTTKK